MVMVALGTMNALSSLKDKEWFKPWQIGVTSSKSHPCGQIETVGRTETR